MDLQDDSYLNRLRDIRREESELIEKLIAERMFLADVIRIDPLTGLYNRRILKKVREFGTVVMCDIDDFKSINDTYGHDTGDEVIKAVASVILDNIRIGDVGIRFGGDEFMIVFTTDRKDVIEKRLESMREKIDKIISLPNHKVTLSFGVAFKENDEDLNTLILNADAALYESKEDGKNQISFYERSKVYRIERH